MTGLGIGERCPWSQAAGTGTLRGDLPEQERMMGAVAWILLGLIAGAIA